MCPKDVLRIGFMAVLGLGMFLQSVPAHAQVASTVETSGQTERGFALSAGVATTPFALDKSLLGFAAFNGSIGQHLGRNSTYISVWRDHRERVCRRFIWQIDPPSSDRQAPIEWVGSWDRCISFE